jgi:extracellular elastinolytic metalloproteinase
MGYYAGTLGADDARPGADFHTPPAHPRTATVTGRVTDRDTGAPVAGLTVALAFQGGGSVNPSSTTDAAGRYTLGPVPVGTYPKLFASGAGYDPATASVTVTRRGGHRDLTVRRDYAAASGGATVTSFNGPDFGAFGCGPLQAIDNNQATGWSTTAGDDEGTPTNTFVPKFMVVDLQQAVDVSEFAVDPSATCGDGGSASTSDYRIETSPDGTTWTTAAAGTFTTDDQGSLSTVTPTAGQTGVRYVKFWILGNQTPDFATSCPGGSFSGCSFADLTELEVYGASVTGKGAGR